MRLIVKITGSFIKMCGFWRFYEDKLVIRANIFLAEMTEEKN